MVFEREDIITAAALGTALLAVLGVGGLIYGLFIDTVGTLAAITLGMMGVILFAVTVFAVQNRRKIKQMEDGEA